MKNTHRYYVSAGAVLTAVLTAVLISACSGGYSAPAAPTVSVAAPVVRSVTVTPAVVTLNAGEKITLASTVIADSGILDRTTMWSSSNADIAAVDGDGVVTAGAVAGNATITAKARADQTVAGSAIITVTVPPPAE